MFGKRERAWEENALPAARRFRANVADLFLSNDVSANRAQSLFADGQASGARNVQDLAAAGQGGRLGRNLCRDLKRKLLKGSAWPKPYVAQVPTWNPKKEVKELREVSLLLPHEIIGVMTEEDSTTGALLRQELGSHVRDHLSSACRAMGADLGRAIGLGLWGDGVPYNYDRSASLDVFALSFPGFEDHRLRTCRIPLVAMDHKHVIKGETMDALMEVLAWSFTFLALGRHPYVRHDNAPWDPSDGSRSRKAGSPIAVFGFLVECRGDWKQLKDVFRFPQFNENAGICWLCACTPQTWRLVDENAPWRHDRLDHEAFLARLRAKGLQPSPLFASPGLTTQCFRPDWLHVVDLGVASDFLGNFLLHVCSKLEGNSHKERVGQLWQHIQSWYGEFQVENRLQNLVPTMLRKSGSVPPKLRAKAAQARALVPFAVMAADRFLQPEAGFVDAMAEGMAIELNGCYSALSVKDFNHQKLAYHCRRFCILAVKLEAEHDGVLWRCKPKLHLFQELCEFHFDCPSLYWTYRDEDFGGSMAQLAKRRGGPTRPGVASKAVLDRFCAKHKLPRF
mgnify:CR=1 FL=1